jgi:hypothetical protein
VSKRLVELRILPPFALARLGSSSTPMENYDFDYPDAAGYRKIVAAPTLQVDPATGAVSLRAADFEVKFRDGEGRIKPISPFLELWAREAGSEELVPLTTTLLAECDVSPQEIRWQVEVGNIKAFRRTGNANDQILADTGSFSDHEPKWLQGTCKNFVEGASIPFGSAQYLEPSGEFPEIRLRFTPAAGYVYGTATGIADQNVRAAVYDPKGPWHGYRDAVYDLGKDQPGGSKELAARKVTNPGAVYAGYTDPNNDEIWISRGYLDDECDGMVTARLGELEAFARIAAGPPNFAPDSLPVRTVADELEQALGGPSFDEPATEGDLADVREIVRRALETVRLMNTSMMNAYSTQPGVGMARMDTNDVKRAPTPIFDMTLVDPAAIQARHERVLLALESGTLTWFAQVLREYDQTGDLSDAGRHRMPAMMRGADGRYLALTRRQISKVRASAEFVLRNRQPEVTA